MESRDFAEALRILRSLGLRKSEALVYLKILSNEGITALELSSELNMPLSKLYIILKNLEKRGLIDSYGKKKKIYRASKPEVSILELLKEKEESIRRDLEFMRDFIAKMSMERERLEIPPIYIIRKNILSRLKKEMKTVKSEILIALPNNLVKDLLRDIDFLLKKNIVVSVILYSGPEIDHILRQLSKMKGCLTVKRREIYAMDLLVIDRSKAFIFSSKNKYAMMIEDPEIVKAMIQIYYYMLWLPSKVIIRGRVRPNTMLSFSNMWRAVYEVKEFLRQGYEVEAHVVGRYTRNGQPFKGKGYVVDAKTSEDKTVFNLVIDFNGKRLSVGGIDARIEDIEAFELYLIPFK